MARRNHPTPAWKEGYCRRFMDADPKARWIFGANEYAVAISKLVDVAGFVDDFRVQRTFEGRPVIRAEEIPSDALVVAALLGRPFAAKNRLDEIGVRHVDFFSFYEYSGLSFPPLRFWWPYKEEIRANGERYSRVASQLSDPESREVFQKIMKFRMSADLSFLDGFLNCEHRQYFEEFLHLTANGEVFVDVGAYDGTTSLEFIKRCPAYQSVYLFEPNQENIGVAKEKLRNHPNISFFQKGLWNKKERLTFSSNGSTSTICQTGTTHIDVDVLDEIVDGRVTFIKMDIEGAEIPALEGSRQTIRNNHPRLAISAYHQLDDFWRIPSMVLSIRDDYKIYLRHYTEGVVETVMFFVPK